MTGLLLTLTAWSPAAADEPTVPTQRMDRFVRAQMDAHGVPGLAYAVVGPEGPVHTRTYGTDGDGNPVTGSTPFLWGSVAKPVAATVVMELVESGRLALDDPVGRQVEAIEPTITVRHLLSHMSGLSTSLEHTDRFGADRRALDVVPRVTSADLVSRPGSAFHYSSTNYLVLAAVVEAVTGRPYADVLRDRVLEPAGMGDMVTTPQQARERLPPGHRLLLGRPTAFTSPFDPAGVAYGYLGGSLTDATRYADVLLGSGGGLSSRQRTAMFRGTVRTGPDQRYGLGWRTWPLEDTGGTMIWHGGAVAGYQAAIVVLPERERAVIVLQNVYSPFRDRQYLDTAFGIARILHGRTPQTTSAGFAYPASLGAVAALWGMLLVLLGHAVLQLRRGRRASVRNTVLWLVALSVVLLGGLLGPQQLGIDLGRLDLWAPDLAWLLYGVMVATTLLMLVRVALAIGLSRRRRPPRPLRA